MIAAAFADASLAGWDGFGLAIQAYQKRAGDVIGYVDDLARSLNRKMMVRLVKGAYWDTEIKRAQERGLDGYPVFTRKAMTDLNYIACARQLLGLRPRLFPQFATHNALTVATILELAGGESVRVPAPAWHGRSALCAARRRSPRHRLSYLCAGRQPPRPARLSGAAAAGEWRQLVLVALAADETMPVAALLQRPADVIGTAANARHPNIPLPRDLFSPQRENSRGIEFGERAALSKLVSAVAAETAPATASIAEATSTEANAAIAAARMGFRDWSRTPEDTRAKILECAAGLLQQRSAHFIALLQREGGKTLDDALSEVREATDFCRYYAAQGTKLFGAGEPMPGPTGESNGLILRGRGVFVAISPWNFPLAIFLGQVTAALMAGNAVVAKPAEQTPLIAVEAIALLHEAGVPASALQLVQGGGASARRWWRIPNCRRRVHRLDRGRTHINRTLAAKDGPIVPLIAETGGINAMIVDATALPEQVADDVVTSAFRSAGQRCSALRLLFVQDDVADRMIEMIAGAARELRIGDPTDPATHIGPVIDIDAKQRLDAHIARMKQQARVHFAGTAPAGNFVAPHVFELPDAGELKEEVFGPVLHLVRYRANRLDEVLQSIERSGYGLTLGIHSRIDDTIEHVIERLQIGNIYVNRNMIGAVVGVQPFGGHGLSGTGPKAGGPHYLARFATEQTVTSTPRQPAVTQH